MSQDVRDGIYIDKSIIMIDEKKKDFSFSDRTVQFLIIIMATWASLGILTESLSIPCNLLYIKLAILVFSAVFYTCCIYPGYKLVKLFFGILLYGLYLFSRLQGLKNGIYIFENLTMDRISAYYGTQNIQFVADYTVQEQDTTRLVIMILIPVTALLCVTVIRSRLIRLSFCLLLIPMILCFAFGLVPSERYLLVLVVSLFYIKRSSFNSRDKAMKKEKNALHKISSKAAIWLSLFCILTFFLMKFIITQKQYNNMDQILVMKTKLQSAITNYTWDDFTKQVNSIRLFGSEVNYGGISGGVLGKAGQVRYTNMEHLKLRAPMNSVKEGIYLKGFVGSIYTGDRWDGHSEELRHEYDNLQKKFMGKSYSTVNQANQFLSSFTRGTMTTTLRELEGRSSDSSYYSISEGTMEIEYKNGNRAFLYVPYFADYDALSDLRYEADLYAKPALSKNNYFYNYFFRVAIDNFRTDLIGSWDEAVDYAECERLYRDFVYKAYTILPEEGLDNIKRDFPSDYAGNGDGSIIEKISYVRNYLEQNTEYSLSPGVLPMGKDFVEYFLYENKLGYCVHYASAAALMLRSMGIPARYVEGYVVDSGGIIGMHGTDRVTYHTKDRYTSYIDSLVEVSVRDYNAHAWVEVYFNGIGWIPVEFTPGASVDYTRTVVADLDHITRSMEKEEKKNEQEEQEITQAPSVITPKITQAADNEPIRKERIAKEEQQGETKREDNLPLTIILTAASLMTVFYLRNRAAKAKKTRLYGNYNKRAINLYSDIEKMLIFCRSLPKNALLEESEADIKEHASYLDAESLEMLMGIVKRARFGQGMISKQELKTVLSIRNRLYQKIYEDQSMIKKLHLILRLSFN
jgi:transglutaminase-like putative cysteine protease